MQSSAFCTLKFSKCVDSILTCIAEINHKRGARPLHITHYYMEESVLLGTKPLVDSIRHFIRDPSGVFSVCHLCECRIVQ